MTPPDPHPYLRGAQTLDVGAVDLHDSVPWLQGAALLPVPDSLHDGHPAPRTAARHVEAQTPFAVGQHHRDQLPPAQTAEPAALAHRPRGRRVAGAGGGAAVAMETVEAAVVRAVRGGRRPEVRGLRPEEVEVAGAGAPGGGQGPPGGLRQRQAGPRQGAGGQVALGRLGRAVSQRVGRRRQRVIVVISDH